MTPDEVFATVRPQQITVFEAHPSEGRAAALQGRVEVLNAHGASAWYLDLHRDHGGPWAGLNTFLTDVLDDLKSRAPELLAKHDYELAMILPTIQRSIKIRNPNLTDLSVDAERTRNYAADRAYRVVHGVIDLLISWHRQTGAGTWWFVLDNLEHAGGMSQLFVTEFIRRAGHRLPVALVIGVAPGSGAATADRFAAGLSTEVVALEVRSDDVSRPSPAEWTTRAMSLEAQVGADVLELELQLPHLIRSWLKSDQPDRAVMYQYQALSMYGTRGLYTDALSYGEALLAVIELPSADQRLRLNTYIKLYNCYIGLGQPDRAFSIASLVLGSPLSPEARLTWHYLMSMLYARYLPDRDFTRAEAHLELGMNAIREAVLPRHVELFQTAFNRNGLALVRHFQGRREQALSLCKTAFDALDQEFSANEHQLHRSVLLYNIAQVHDAMGNSQEAAAYYTAALQMDPNYSEYYNERGSLHLKMGRLDLAIQDYHRAIELSPPYAEVWVNLGQCHALQGDDELALQSYDRALDLAPGLMLALLGRAQSHDVLGHLSEALADYTAVLELDPQQPLVLANRASVLFQLNRIEDAINDLNQALRLDPDSADLRENLEIAWSGRGH